MQRWSPDTCSCVVIEDASGTNKILDHFEHKCPLHDMISDDTTLYNAIYADDDGENKVKNILMSELLDQGETKNFGLAKDDFTISFEGTGVTRTCVVVVAGMIQGDKNILRNFAASKFTRTVRIE